MLKEYAVDPEVFADLSSLKLWYERFGIERGRVIANYPRKWQQQAMKGVSASPVARSSVVDRIRRMKERGKLIDLDRRPYDGDLSWLDNALTQNETEPFDGIITRVNPGGRPEVLLAEEVEEDTPGFVSQTGGKVPRTASAMADAIRRILWAATRLVLVDPYFHPSEARYLCPFTVFVEEARKGRRLEKVEVHLSGAVRNRAPHDAFERACRGSLAEVLPRGVQVTLVRWEEQPQGESLHARYVLTDFCGVQFEHGLDEETEHQTCDVTLLPEDTYRTCLKQYEPEADAFRRIDTTIIEGTREE